MRKHLHWRLQWLKINTVRSLKQILLIIFEKYKGKMDPDFCDRAGGPGGGIAYSNSWMQIFALSISQLTMGEGDQCRYQYQ